MCSKNKIMQRAVLSAIAVCISMPAMAASIEQVKIDGFLSARYSVTDEAANYQEEHANNGINEDGSFYGTKLGLNITVPVANGITVATQMLSAIQEDNYSTHIDWAFINVPLGNSVNLRAGKIKFPVGLVNEYVDVGVATPWIQAPVAIYSESGTGPQATREAYTGASVQWEGLAGDMSYGVDLFGGQVDLTGMTIKSLMGVTAKVNWNEMVDVQVSTYQGVMHPDDPTSCPAPTCSGEDIGMGVVMDGKSHQATTLGIKAELGNVLLMSEMAQVKMDSMMGKMDSDSWYVTLGYRMGVWMPHVTMQDWSQESGYGHAINSLGLNYSLSPKTVIKTELSQITTSRFDDPSMMFTNAGVDAIGLFDGNLSAESTQLISIALETVF